MTLEDIAQLRIKVLDGEAVKSFETLQASVKDVKNQLKEMELAGQKNTEEYKALVRVQRDLGQELTKTTKGVDLQNASMNEMNALKRKLNQELVKLKVGSEEWISKLKEVQTVNAKLGEVSNTVKGQEGVWSKFGGWIKGAFALTGIIALVGWIVDLGRSIFDTTAKFEKYRTVLNTALGSQEMANAAFGMLQKIAATTPFSLDEMTSSFIKLVNRGILPTTKELKQMADIAASQGKSFDQLTEAVLDAQMGESERLKEFGIRMRTNGDMVSLSFKQHTVEVKNNEKAIYDAIVAMGLYEGVAGSTSSMMDTLSGKTSNLGDMWDMVMYAIGEKLKPVFVWLLDAIMKGVQYVGLLVDNVGVFTPVLNLFTKYLGFAWKSVKDLFVILFPEAGKMTLSFGGVMKWLAAILNIIPSSLMVIATAIKASIGAFSLLGDAAKVVGKFMSGDFAGASAAATALGQNYEKLKNTVVVNFKAIGNSFTDIFKTQEKGISTTDDLWNGFVKSRVNGEKKVTEDKAKNAKEREKAQKEAHKKELDRFNELYDQTQVLWQEHLDIMKELDDAAIKDRTERNKIMGKAIEGVEKNIEQTVKDRHASHHELEKRYANFTKEIGKEIVEANKKHNEEIEQNAKESAEKRKEIIRDLTDQTIQLANEIMESIISDYQKKFDEADSVMDKFMKEQALKQAKNTQTMVNGMASIMSGDVVKGAFQMVKGLISYFDNELNAYQKAIEARAKETLSKMKSNLDYMTSNLQSLNSNLDNISTIYVKIKDNNPFDGLADTVGYLAEVYKILEDSLQKTSEIYDRSNASSSMLVEAEAEVGNKIMANYNLAVESENKLFDKKMSDEDKRYNDAIAKINEQYNIEVSKINEKYDLINAKNSERFNAESLAIAQGVNTDLLNFITNEDLKIGLIAEYEKRRNDIKETFALAYKPITEGMSQAEIEGINAAIKARDEAFAKLAAWQTEEVQFAIKNNQLKIDSYTDVEKIIQKGKEDTYQLDLQYQALSIKNASDRAIEIEEATKAKNAASEIITKGHLDNLESINKTHNDTLVAMSEARDAAIAASFERLKSNMISAIADMQAAYAHMVANGIEGSEALLAELNKLKDTFRTLYNENPLPTTTRNDAANNTNKTTTPSTNTARGYANGTEYVDPANRYPSGVDTVPAMVNRGERIIPANLNAMLGGISNAALVAKLVNSNLYRNGSSLATNSGMVNLAHPSSVNNINNYTNSMSTAALEQAVLEMNQKLEAQIGLLANIVEKPTGVNFHELKSAFKQDAELSRRASF